MNEENNTTGSTGSFKGKVNPRGFKPATKTKNPAKENSSAAPKRDISKEAKDKVLEMSKGLGAIYVRNEFYRDGYRNMLRVAVVQSLIIVGLIGVMFYVVHIHQPENRYFATTVDGRTIPMIPLSAPNLSKPALLSWATQSVTDVMSFGFNDYHRRLQESSVHFTRKGWSEFVDALDKARILEMVKEHQQIVTAAPTQAPVLESSGVVNGVYQWTVRVPIIVTYQSGNKKRSDHWNVYLNIVRVSRLESPHGVGINTWISQ